MAAEVPYTLFLEVNPFPAPLHSTAPLLQTIPSKDRSRYPIRIERDSFATGSLNLFVAFARHIPEGASELGKPEWSFHGTGHPL
jgi:hypothetical protein